MFFVGARKRWLWLWRLPHEWWILAEEEHQSGFAGSYLLLVLRIDMEFLAKKYFERFSEVEVVPACCCGLEVSSCLGRWCNVNGWLNNNLATILWAAVNARLHVKPCPSRLECRGCAITVSQEMLWDLKTL